MTKGYHHSGRTKPYKNNSYKFDEINTEKRRIFLPRIANNFVLLLYFFAILSRFYPSAIRSELETGKGYLKDGIADRCL